MNPRSDKIPNTHDCTATKEELEGSKDIIFHILNCLLAVQRTDPFLTKPQSQKHLGRRNEKKIKRKVCDQRVKWESTWILRQTKKKKNRVKK